MQQHERVSRARYRRGGAVWSAAAASLVCALAAAVPAATPESGVAELDEVQITATVPRPLQDYIEFPRYDSVVLSPGGTQIATGWTEDNYQRQLSFYAFPSMKRGHVELLQAPLGVVDIRWANEHQVLIQPDWPAHGFLRLRHALDSIMVFDVEGRNPQSIHPLSGASYSMDPVGDMRREEQVASGPKQFNTGRSDNRKNGTNPAREAQGPVRLIEARTAVADQALFQTTRTDQDGNTDGYGAFLLNLRDHKQSRVALLPLPDGHMITGPEHQVAVLSGVTAHNEQVVYYLPPAARAAGRDWQLRVHGAPGERGLTPVAWTGSGEEYYALDGRDLATRAVVVWNAADNTQRLLYRNPDADMDTVSLDPAGKPWMFAGTGHFPVYWYPDPAHPLAQLHHTLAQRLPNEQVDVTSATDDLAFAVVRVSSGARPPVYLVVDVKTAKPLTSMLTYPKLKGSRLSPVDAIELHARDGVTLHAYLTTPLDIKGKPRRGLPLLVIAHDGPRGQPSDYRYEFERQLFASRGYAVLQVNHRGMSGRGAAFERLGDGQWGRQVQDDFIDATRWALKDGVAAAGQVCFIGAGYGAYSALMAAAREPDLFQCVIGVGGVYDLPALVGNDGQIPPDIRRAFGSDPDELKARSPVDNAASVKAKVLLIQQQEDEHIPPEQSSRMRSALKAAGNAPQWEVIGTEHSGYFTLEDRAAVYTRMLAFLKKQIDRDE